MDFLCALGIHDWTTKTTARAGVNIHRCCRCNAFVRTVRSRRRRQKRYYFLGAILVSLSLWYVAVALGLTGHTKVLWGAEHLAHGVDHAARKINRKIDKLAGAPQQ